MTNLAYLQGGEKIDDYDEQSYARWEPEGENQRAGEDSHTNSCSAEMCLFGMIWQILKIACLTGIASTYPS